MKKRVSNKKMAALKGIKGDVEIYYFIKYWTLLKETLREEEAKREESRRDEEARREEARRDEEARREEEEEE